MTEPDWALAAGRHPRLTFAAFCETHELVWTRFARAGRLGEPDVRRVVTRTREHLWQAWPIALREHSTAAYAWRLLKEAIAVVTAERDAGGAREPAGDEQPWQEAACATVDRIGLRVRTWQEKLAVHDALGRLSERHHDVLVLSYGLGLPDRRIADYLDTTEADVRARLRRARATLERTFGSEQPPGSPR
ncbi:sigma factor-like helix-turn-helix DNA-binding protein [Kitasatospora viridis]|uniref:RNA polymerase sigma factor (Sigma-70 family) n=1 Tax=Kitasatospora viridis TaxID=281105 RepID=A0A561TUX4_9ACTN|nr:sigma factor-like helix-turn-helix DNA-binding protein [Kitasatospora viridis]TWF90916.1 RNA polymerase sigma factor (sigma-70 family) [Kitasatospora viridis]